MATTRGDFSQSNDPPEREPLTPAQVDALTEALNQLTERIGDASQQAPGTAPPLTAAPPGPWWYKAKPNYPGQPDFDPNVMRIDAAHQQWWARNTAGNATAGGMGGGMPPGGGNVAGAAGDEPDPDDFSFVRSFWRRKAQRRAERREQEGGGGAKPPWWTRYTEAAGGEDGSPQPEGWETWRNRKEAPTATEYRVPWNRKRKKAPWHWGSFTRKAGAWARMRFGKRGQRMAVSGLATAAGRIARGWSPHAALRAGAFAGAAAGGGATLGMAALALGAVKAAQALERLTERQLEYNRHLGESSALMRQVFAERDVQQRLRDREMGDRLSPSARALTQAEQTEKEGTKELDIAMERTKNAVGTAWEEFKTVLFFQLNEYSRLFNYFIELFEGKQEGSAMDDWARRIAADDAKARKDKVREWEPPRFR